MLTYYYAMLCYADLEYTSTLYYQQHYVVLQSTTKQEFKPHDVGERVTA